MRSISNKTSNLPASGTMRMSQEANRLKREGKDIVSLSMGEPDFPTPKHIIEAAEASMRRGETHYVAAPGIPRLREAISLRATEENGIECSPTDVLVAPTKQCIYLALSALLNPGDEVLLPDPGWVSYESQILAADGIPKPFKHKKDNSMDLDSIAQAISPKTKAIIVNSPSNPLGSVMSEEVARGICELAIENDLYVISDEIYEKLVYEGRHISPAAMDGMQDRTITISGFSKSYAMTGWRLGWAIAPKTVFTGMLRLHEHTLTCLPQFIQEAGIAALTGPEDPLREMVAEFRERRMFLMKLLKDISGLRVDNPQGAFYVFPSYEMEENSEDLTLRMLSETGVAVTPGSAFGQAGEGHIRISYAASRENIQQGVEGIKKVFS